MSAPSPRQAADALAKVKAAVTALETALSSKAILENCDVVVCMAQGRLMSAPESTKEALSSLEDVL